MDRRALILIHDELEGAGLLEVALRAAGFEPVDRFRRLEPGDGSAPLVVAMGGSMAVYEAERHPFLSAEIALLKGRLAEGRPSLGICLGAQLLAAAAGAEVRRGRSGLELGVFPVSFTPEAGSDGIFADLPSKTRFVHWHQDEFDAVPGAVGLAYTDRYRQQAFRLGTSYGVQFHPELDAAMFEAWLRASPAEVERSGRGPGDVLATDLPMLRASQPTAERLLARLAEHFANRCFRLSGTDHSRSPGGRDASSVDDKWQR
jgi:GMP synthase (glutamine-hydrolysing)